MTKKIVRKPIQKEIVYKTEGQEYAKVAKMLGNSRVELECENGIKRLGIICGTMKKKIWINTDDYVLISLRDFQDKKADIIHKYTPDEVKILRRTGHIENKKVDEKEEDEDDDKDVEINFDDV